MKQTFERGKTQTIVSDRHMKKKKKKKFGKAAVDRFQSERTDAFQKVRLKRLKNLLLNRPRFMRAVIELRAQMDR
ncbi:hypothetical protein T12_7974 [Trichinella patagoniensis]|uniref:Uncharacterized protein n=1 Tax=Trichinella patagoniensis TaxID=990121 RepID=A0A0V0ZMV4_9BILA|nr:hypothetical protein T12_7974 [Trichinella patagoniensis]